MRVYLLASYECPAAHAQTPSLFFLRQNAWVVVISYVAMFIYVSLALGKFPHPVASRILLGLQGK